MAHILYLSIMPLWWVWREKLEKLFFFMIFFMRVRYCFIFASLLTLLVFNIFRGRVFDLLK